MDLPDDAVLGSIRTPVSVGVPSPPRLHQIRPESSEMEVGSGYRLRMYKTVHQ